MRTKLQAPVILLMELHQKAAWKSEKHLVLITHQKSVVLSRICSVIASQKTLCNFRILEC